MPEPSVDEALKFLELNSVITRPLINEESRQQLQDRPYYAYFCQEWRWIAQRDRGQHVAIKTVDQCRQLASRLRGGCSRAEATAYLKNEYLSAATDTQLTQCHTSVHLAVRLLTMMKVGLYPNQARPRVHLSWDDESSSLRDLSQRHFGGPTRNSYDSLALPKSFSAWTIHKVAGIEIEFTNNLVEHLLLVEGAARLKVFHQASFLERQDDALFSEDLINETLRTLALLFPQPDFHDARRWRPSHGRIRWFQKLCQNSDFLIDERVIRCGTLRPGRRQLENFHFWRDRLAILKETFDQATPQRISQWWYDGRNGVQWSTFWVAILVLIITTVLGIIQCVEGALQVYKAFQE